MSGRLSDEQRGGDLAGGGLDDSCGAGTLDGRLVTVSAFTMKDAAETDLARVVIVCCAADAQPARIHFAGAPAAVASGVPEDTWLEIEGRVRARDGRALLQLHLHAGPATPAIPEFPCVPP